MREFIAEMAATVSGVEIGIGEQVGKFQTLLTLESMKMRIPIVSETAGTVTQISVRPGDVVEAGQVMVVLDTEARPGSVDVD